MRFQRAFRQQIIYDFIKQDDPIEDLNVAAYGTIQYLIEYVDRDPKTWIRHA